MSIGLGSIHLVVCVALNLIPHSKSTSDIEMPLSSKNFQAIETPFLRMGTIGLLSRAMGFKPESNLGGVRFDSTFQEY